MQNEYEYDFDQQNVEDFRINPHVWLQTLLAIAGDKDRKKEVIQIVSEQSGLPLETVEVIFGSAIKALVGETRSN